MIPIIGDKLDYIYNIQDHIDVRFYTWLFWLWWPFILVTVILPSLIWVFLYISACIVHIHRIRHYFRVNDLIDSNVDFKKRARATIALLWECHGWFWHGYEVIGMENIPSDSGALIVYYHGVVPIDYYYLNAKCLIYTKRTMWTIAAEFLFKVPGLKNLMDAIQATPGTREQIGHLLRKGELVSVAPGGIREAQFSNEYYELVWNNHIGFAKAAILGKAPIIPVFTQNIREVFRTSPFFRGFFRKVYEKTKFPPLPVYGGFPVKLRTYIGKPIPYDENASAEEVAERAACAIRELIEEHQLLPGSIVKALIQRFDTRKGI